MAKKIMVVDDEDAIRLLYQEEFEDEGYEVIACADGEEALEKFDKENPDIVVLDIAMPGMSGLDVLSKIKEKSPKTPVIMSTAYSHYKDDFYTYVADAYIVKSPDLTELKEKVKELIGE
ncbi:response regulator [Hippea alviniae]|uniref:response regulator n=1 Tax=Hippea alviniae TaxID=1279027 RepID=UPI0003B74266|nr:response regulator [Hippea alviniae]